MFSWGRSKAAAPADGGSLLGVTLQLPNGEKRALSLSSAARGADVVELASRESGLVIGSFRLMKDGVVVSPGSSLLGWRNASVVVLELAGGASGGGELAGGKGAGAAAAPPPAATAPAAPSTGKGGAVTKPSPECVICLESFSAAWPPTSAGACGHGFHAPCLAEWKTNSAYCPLCRALMEGCAHPPPAPPHQSSAPAPAPPPPPQQQQMQQIQRYAPAAAPAAAAGGSMVINSRSSSVSVVSVPTGSTVLVMGGTPYVPPPPPSLAEVTMLLSATRARVQASVEWQQLRAAVNHPATRAFAVAAGNMAVHAVRGAASIAHSALRGIASASPGPTGTFAAAIAGPAVMQPTSRVCPRCHSHLHLPQGASPTFRCGTCSTILQR